MSQSVATAEAVQVDEFVSGQYHLRIRVGVAEFDCEGPANLVREDYREFLDLIDRVGCKAIAERVEQIERPGLNGPEEDCSEESNGLESGTWERLFMRKEDRLSLNIIPDTKAPNSDAILLLIYGYQKLFQLEGVTSVTLMDAAKQSGLRIDRIDRNVCSEHNKLLLKGGSGKGSRYSLNNRGLHYVEQLLNSMFD